MKNFDNLICEIADEKCWTYGAAEKYFNNALRFVARVTGRTMPQMKSIINGMSVDQFETLVFGVIGAVQDKGGEV